MIKSKNSNKNQAEIEEEKAKSLQIIDNKRKELKELIELIKEEKDKIKICYTCKRKFGSIK